MKKKTDISPELLRDLLAAPDHSPSTDELQDTEEALWALAQAHAQAPPPALKDSIMAKIMRLSDQKTAPRQVIDLKLPPMIDADTNWLDWQEAVKHIAPPANFADIHLHTLRDDDQVQLFVAFVREMVPEEVHHDLLESFILLEGTCQCHITDETGLQRIVHMSEGDYIAFALGETHDIFITSGPAKAILQWAKLAA